MRLRRPAGDVVLHWRDFVCPFCYVGQSRSAYLRSQGLEVVDLPFPIHPEIPEGGAPAPVRNGPMYAFLEREAAEAGLPLRWPPRLPNTRLALSAAEWVRRHQPPAGPALDAALFAAHFAEGRDIGDVETVMALAAEAGVDTIALRDALDDGTAVIEMVDSARRGTAAGVTGTPAWLVGDRLVEGLQPFAAFVVQP